MALFTHAALHDPHGRALEQPFFLENGYTKAPAVIQCYVTLRCGLSCAHCLAVRESVIPADMPVALFEKCCREAAELGVEEILLTGGEPLQHGNLSAIIDSLMRCGLAWSINTAACPTLPQQEAIRRYPPFYAAVSLDGPAAIHDLFRGRSGAFADALSSLRFFSSIAGTTVCAGTTVTRRNFPCFEDTFQIVRASGAHRWGIHLLLPEGRARTRKDLFLTRREMRRLLAAVTRARAVFPVTLCDEMGFVGSWENLVRDEAFFCAAGRAMCAVLPDGSVMPCSTLDPRFRQGHLASQTLADVWRDGFSAQRRPHLQGKCRHCSDQSLCRGGCWLQRVHGTQCFRPVWSLTPAMKASAGVALCLGGLTAAAGAESGGTNAPVALLPLRGVYMSKAGPRRPALYPGSAEAIARGLLWLKACQNSNGSWGDPETNLTATALATLAFLSDGDTPASRRFGITVEKALKALLEAPEPDPRDECQAAITAWCLAEAYAVTASPILEQATVKRLTRLSRDRTAWHILAWRAAAQTRLAAEASEGHPAARVGWSSATTDVLDVAVQCLMDETTDTRRAVTRLEIIRGRNWNGWKRSREPLLCAVLINKVTTESYPGTWPDWIAAFAPDLHQAQVTQATTGWWSGKDFGLEEASAMPADGADIAATALAIIALQPSRSYSPRRHPLPKPPGASADTDINVTIP